MFTSLLVLLALAASLAVSVVRDGDTTGPVLILGHLADLGAALAILTVSAAIGTALLRRFSGGLDSPLERLLFGTVVGTGVLSSAILVVVALGGAGTGVLAAVLAGAVIGVRSQWRGFGDEVRRALAELVGLTGGGRSRFVLLGYGAIVAFLLCMALAPPSDWDSMMYHLQIPVEWLREGRIFVPGANDHTALIGLPHLLYLPLLATGSMASPAVLSALVTLLLGLSVFVIGAHFWRSPTPNYLLAAVWGFPAIVLVGMTARVDCTLTLFTLLAHYALLRAWLDPAGAPWLELGGILLGFAFGVKYQAGLYAVALIPLILLACVRRSESVSRAWRPFLRFGLLACIAASPWLLKNWFLLHAPLYPFLSRPMPQAWLSAIPAGVSPVPPIDPRANEILQSARVPFNLVDAFLAPGRLSVEAEAQFYFLSPILLLLPMWLLRWRERVLWGFGGPALIYLAVLLIRYPEINLRYLIPALVPLTMLATALAVEFAKMLSARVRAVALSALVLLAVFPVTLTMAFWISRTSAVGHLAGATSGNVYLETHFLSEVRSHERLAEATNRAVPLKGLILMIFDARGLYLRPHVIEDTRVNNWAMVASRVGLDRCLGDSGITHVLASDGAARYYEARGVPPEVLRWEDFERFAAACLTPVYADSGLTLYRVGRSTTP